MLDPNAWVNILKIYGIPTFVIIVLTIIIILVVQDPNRAVQLKAFIIEPFFKLFKIGSKQYIAARVSSAATDFIAHQLGKELSALANTKVKVKWVNSPEDPVLRENGTLILHMQETNDQSRNILAATKAALPTILCPTIRTNMQSYIETAIDMEVLFKLAEKLGKHALPVYQQYFLEPETKGNQEAKELLKRLRIIDRFGVFVSIFLEELNNLGATVFLEADNSDKSDSITQFLYFLLNIASREVNEPTPLQFISKDIKVAVLLLARSDKVESEGVTPYIDRIKSNMTYTDSTYIITYEHLKNFLPRLLEALKTNSSIIQIKNVEVDSFRNHNNKSNIIVTMLQPQTIGSTEQFDDSVNKAGIELGSRVKGTIVDVSGTSAVVTIDRLEGIIFNNDCSWLHYEDCAKYFTPGEKYDFIV
ncbi:MAG: hypothetical protein PHQ86_08530, partial [Dehalococcoidales bacterium]|nr:hypothetical protein [Dehalococcoidales bacterium]